MAKSGPKISNHVESIQSIRERNAKVASLSAVISKNLPKLDPIHADGGPNASLVEKQDAFTDVLLAALISGLTNVVTYTIDDLGTPITTLPGNNGASRSSPAWGTATICSSETWSRPAT